MGGLLLGLVHLGNAWAQATCDSTDTAVTAANPTNAVTLAADCSALLAIKDTLRGTASLNWTNTLNMTTWDGIFLTTSRDNVQEIRLSNRSMDGSIPDLSALTSLTAINLSANQLSESIPDLSALTKLTQLYLQNNQLSGSVPDLSALTNLGTLALSGNDLTGSIVAARFPTSLQSLNLRGNQLSGSVPDLSALTNLGTLALGGNDLTGSIVAARFPTSLQSLYLHGNQLSGSIPDLSALTNLSLLWIHRNELSGSIPATLSALSGLTELHLAGNDLTGSIPSGLGNLANLSQLSLCETDLDSAATLPAALEARRTAVTPSLTVWSCVTLPEDASGPEGTFLAFPARHSTFPVRGGPGATSVEVPWWTNDGTATSEDYAGRSEDDPGSVTIPANTDTATSTSTATIRVRALVDSLGLEEGEESFTLRLGRPPDNAVGIGDSAIGTIRPMPPPPPPDDPEVEASFGSLRYEAPEGATVDVTVVLSGDPEREVSIPLVRTHGGGASEADYSGVPASITFSSGVTARTFTFTAADDGEDDDGESVVISFGDLPSRVTGGAGTTVSIRDNDDPEVEASFASSTYEAPEGGSVEVTVILSADPEREVSIPLVRTHGGGASEADYSGVPASITFSSGVTARTFEFAATDDSEKDFGESVVLGFGRLPAGVSGGGPATVSIGDDDTPPMAVIEVSGVECDRELCRALTGEPVEFADVSTGPGTSRRWEFEGGTESSLRRLSHSWSEPGFYEVTLWVSDGARESTASRVFLVESSEPAGTCAANAETLCLQHSRYAVVVDWWSGAGARGSGSVVHAGTNDSGLFRFFNRENRETLIKVLDGCAVNGHVWVYGASTTDLGYLIRVTDTVTGLVKEYRNEPGQPASAITDADAFADGCREP
ncbi:MAG: PKD domain-containing protein [Acidobacteria bacterium]|nr:PKD domain-containing protein [Acidobacteriota bacterium]